jgi:predicted O-linked N-acetylglucosamine transferase (SPINDLY family)
MSTWQLRTPVVLIIFNRTDTTQRVFDAIREVKPLKLLVISDAPRINREGEAEQCEATRAIINQVDWECEVLTNHSNINLDPRKRISSGLDWVFEQVEEAIVLEHDCLPGATFFRYCEELLEKYRDDERIMIISGNNLQFGRKRNQYSYYFSRYIHIWGWATWRRAWEKYDVSIPKWNELKDSSWLSDLLDNQQAVMYWSGIFDAIISGYDTWDYSLVFSLWINEGLSISPQVNLVSNIGFGENAENCKNISSILANMLVEELEFPLQHPAVISRHEEADDFTENHFFSASEWILNITVLNNAIHLLDKNTNKINLQNITLVTISSVEIELTLLSLVISNLNANFNRVLFFTSEEIDQSYLELFPQLEIIKIHPIKNLVEYSRFIIKELNSFIETEFCLVTQGDGFIINPQLWSEEFLNYDYIGAPWRNQSHLVNSQGQTVDILDLNKNRVGNGGFSLRSKKLLEVCSKLDFDHTKTSSLSEDLIICQYFYEWFKDQGIKFAPLEVAIKFSFEQTIEEIENFSWENTFGFHGKPHVISVLNKLSQDWYRYFNSEKYQNSKLINDLKLQEINIVIFPDWSVDEDNLGWELQQVIQILANHKSKITLLIDVGDTSAEEADIVLAAIAMNLMMEAEIDITEELTISLIIDLNEIQWENLIPRINARVSLQHENQKVIVNKQVEQIPLYSLENLKEASAEQFFFQLGNSLFFQGKYQEAIIQYQKFQQIQIGNPEFYWSFSECFRQLNLLEQCFAVLQAGIKLYPLDVKLHFTVIVNYQMSGRIQEAIRAANIALENLPNNRTFQLLFNLLLPSVYDQVEEIDAYRKRFKQGLDNLINNIPLNNIEDQQNTLIATSCWTNFYLPYQADNVVVLQSQYGNWLHQIMKANYPQWSMPLLMPPLKENHKIRIGYASNYLHSYSGTLWLTGWLKYCDHDNFEIYCYYTGNQPDPITEKFQEYSDFFYHIPGNLPAVCQQIMTDKLHILVYPEIGMDAPTMQMAGLRLAPVQCTAWGHPVTTGLPTIDYFLSSQLMEGENAQEHYSEKLILLPNIGVAYPEPYIPPVVKTRSNYGLSDNDIIYLCCQAPFKYLPQYDFILAEIASRVSQAKFVFLRGTVLKPRLERAFAAVGLNSEDYCVHLNIPARLDYVMINLLSDVYLDTFTWSGGNTSLEAIACNLPIVTCPGEFMRGRHTDSFLKLLGVTDTIAKNEAEYIDIAVKLGIDKNWRNSISEMMSQNHHYLFDDQACIVGLEAFYKEVVNGNRN